MAGIFTDGVAEVRPGTYFNVNTNDGSRIVGAQDGIAAVVFKGNWGPLNTICELTETGDTYDRYGDGGNVDALEYAFQGGAKTVLAVRAGTGGTAAKVQIGEIATVTAKYPGARVLSVTVKDSLTEDNAKKVTFYAGNREIESYSITKDGNKEGAALKAAMEKSKNFVVEVNTDGSFPDLSQQAFTAGTDPTVNVDSYAAAFEQLESIYCNAICVDTEDHAVHLLLKSFLDRAYKNGFFACAVLADNTETPVEERISYAETFNDEKVIYILNAKGMQAEKAVKGYQLAAIVAGMYAAYPSNKSLTHKSLPGITELTEVLKPSVMTKAETKGCLVLSMSPTKEVWIDNAINTLVELPEDKDAGWKKIRRTKTRFELMYRMNTTSDSLTGNVDNDKNGRETVIANLNEVGAVMIQEGKLKVCSVTEHPSRKANADYAYFMIDVVDKDSLEHSYLYYMFRYKTEEG